MDTKFIHSPAIRVFKHFCKSIARKLGPILLNLNALSFKQLVIGIRNEETTRGLQYLIVVVGPGVSMNNINHISYIVPRIRVFLSHSLCHSPFVQRMTEE